MSKSGSHTCTVTLELFATSDERVIATGLVGRDLIALPMSLPVPLETGPWVVIRQVSSAGRWEVFLNLSKVRRLLDMRVLERREDLSVQLIEHQWSGSLLGDSWTLEISVPLTDKEGSLILDSLTSLDTPGTPP